MQNLGGKGIKYKSASNLILKKNMKNWITEKNHNVKNLWKLKSKKKRKKHKIFKRLIQIWNQKSKKETLSLKNDKN